MPSTSLEYRLIPSLAILFQSSKYRKKRKMRLLRPCNLTKFLHFYQQNSIIFILLIVFLLFEYLFSSYRGSHQWSVMADDEYSSTDTILSILTNVTTNNQNCVPICQCKWKSGKETANCDHRSLLTVPNGLSPTTQVIDLNGNVLTQLPPMVFLQRGLINLQRIYLANCHLVEISAESFLKLSNLIELDLSNNSLTTVPSRSLAECPGLRRLSLAGNRIRDVKSRSFLPLTNLNWLDLSRNVIFHLDTDAFIGLRSLQVLKMQSNHLQTIPAAQSFTQFLSIRVSLELNDNQWRCDCHLKPFRDWIITNSIPMTIKPICMMPTRLQGQTWDSIAADQFSCPPTIHTVNTHFYKHIGNNVTIACSVSGFPTPRIYWLFESTGSGQTIANEPMTEDLKSDIESDILSEFRFEDESRHRQLLPSSRYSLIQEREQMGIVTSKLTVYALQPIDTQRITCFASNVGGAVMKNFTLIVSTQEPFSSSRSMDLLVSEFMLIVVAICILLMLLMIFLFVVIFRRRSNASGLGSGTNHVTDSSTAPQPNRIGSDTETEYRMLKPPPSNGTIVNGDIANNNEKSMYMDHQTTYINPYHHPNGGLMTASPNILMVNTIDMLARTGTNNFVSDPSVSTDLSSQSTTATSMNGNGATVSPNTNTTNQNTNSTDSGNSQIYYSAFDANSGFQQASQHCSAISNTSQQQQHPDILISSNAYYLTATSFPGSQFPLLNSGPLFTDPNNGTMDHSRLIYGRTKIAPTRMIPTKVTKVKFADELESSLDSTSSSSVSNAYTIATLRRTKQPVDIVNKPLNVTHRNVSSYPEELRLVESSVDSGEPIRISEHLNEADEDDYYRGIQQ